MNGGRPGPDPRGRFPVRPRRLAHEMGRRTEQFCGVAPQGPPDRSLRARHRLAVDLREQRTPSIDEDGPPMTTWTLWDAGRGVPTLRDFRAGRHVKVHVASLEGIARGSDLPEGTFHAPAGRRRRDSSTVRKISSRRRRRADLPVTRQHRQDRSGPPRRRCAGPSLLALRERCAARRQDQGEAGTPTASDAGQPALPVSRTGCLTALDARRPTHRPAANRYRRGRGNARVGSERADVKGAEAPILGDLPEHRTRFRESRGRSAATGEGRRASPRKHNGVRRVPPGRNAIRRSGIALECSRPDQVRGPGSK